MPKDTARGAEGTLGTDAQKQLKSLSDRIGTLLEQRATVNEDLKAVFDEARDAGFDTKILRKAIREVRRDRDEARVEQDMVDTYVHAIQPDLFDAAA